jgi:Carboxypeptidase regulatory-like domain
MRKPVLRFIPSYAARPGSRLTSVHLISPRDRVREQLGSQRRADIRVSSVIAVFFLVICAPAAWLKAQQSAANPQSDLRTSSQTVPQSSLHGVVTDREGAVCEGANITLNLASGSKTVMSDGQGRYLFSDLPSGAYKLTVSAKGFGAQTLSGEIPAGESRELPAVVLLITDSTQVNVTANLEEIATAQLNLQLQQRVLGFLPNFYVSYAKDAAPLTPRQKFKLAFRSQIDPMNFVFTGIAAGIEQSNNSPASWGPGPDGFAKRYAAAYGDSFIDTILAGAVLPSLFHQDPRYFYKGTGTVKARILYAISSVVICRGDNGRRQLNYSSILGDLGSAGISNLYYPASDRNGIGLTLRNFGIGKATDAGQNILQEFVVRHFTPRLPKDPSSN